MELCSEARQAILSLADLGPKPFKDTVLTTLTVLTGEKDPATLHEVRDKHQTEDALAKRQFSGLSTLFLEAAKTNTGPDELRAFIDELITDADRASLVVDAYSEKKALLRTALGSIGFRLPYLNNLTWRCDHVYEGKDSGQPSLPDFTLTFHLQNSQSSNSEIAMRFSKEELEDLLAKMRELVNQARLVG
eukprot:TRINITY_DN83510_c0_g1_i1.p1 TRINITY_DN83510_c0_g1~~TRINITY_DN83510_c0_g1_i1.p1  ORF type:complete len:190 (-),score=32.13 TRINITY_DN83510_c0_g1_i1:105-674(-)